MAVREPALENGIPPMVNIMRIASEREGSISTTSFHGQLPDY